MRPTTLTEVEARDAEQARYEAMLPYEQVRYRQEHRCAYCAELMLERMPDGTDWCRSCDPDGVGIEEARAANRA